MKKLIFSFAAIVLLSFGLINWKQATGGAVVIDDHGCSMFDGNGNFVWTDNSHVVVTPSGNGMIRCDAQLSNTTGKAVVYTDLDCDIPDAGYTTSGFETVSSSGHATLVCNFNAH